MKVLIAASLVISMYAVPAAAQTCPIAHPQQQQCIINGCSGEVTRYYCSGYGNLQTCGGPCTGTVTCCGYVFGYQAIQCNTLCAGCQPTTKKKVAKTEKSDAARPSEDTGAASEATSAVSSATRAAGRAVLREAKTARRTTSPATRITDKGERR